MGQAARWEKIAREWNGKYYPAKGLGMEQKVVAARDGYLTVIGTMVRGGSGVGYVAIRFPRGGTWQDVPDAAVRDREVRNALGKWGSAASFRKRLKVEDGLLWFDRPYFLRAQPEWLAAVANALSALLPGYVGRFSGRCEVCSNAPVAEPLLVNGSPAYVCPGCLQTGQQEETRAERAYALQTSRPALGLLAGAAAAIGGGFAWALVAILTERIFSALAIGIGILVAYAVKAGMGKINFAGQVLTGVLTLGGVFAGQVFYVAHLLQNRIGHYDFAVAFKVYLKVLQENPTAELMTLVFALIGMYVSLSAMKHPSFRSKVERV